MNTSVKTRLAGLIDGAAHPSIYRLLLKSGATFLPVYEGLAEAALGQAGLFLIEIDDLDAQWVVEVDQLDLQTPCLSLIWSRVPLGDLAMHLRAFLIADIPGDKTALVRYFDPRNTGVVFQMWPESVMHAFIGPIERWLFRGRNKDWHCVENDALSGADICTSIAISLGQEQLRLLRKHTEPDGILAALVEQGLVDAEMPYLERWSDFVPRYERAIQWGLTTARDRKRYCEYSYLRGKLFDRDAYVHAVLSQRKTTGQGFDAVMDRMPDHVWAQVERSADANDREGGVRQ